MPLKDVKKKPQNKGQQSVTSPLSTLTFCAGLPLQRTTSCDLCGPKCPCQHSLCPKCPCLHASPGQKKPGPIGDHMSPFFSWLLDMLWQEQEHKWRRVASFGYWPNSAATLNSCHPKASKWYRWLTSYTKPLDYSSTWPSREWHVYWIRYLLLDSPAPLNWLDQEPSFSRWALIRNEQKGKLSPCRKERSALTI